jgi:large subunit ribosomal protein L10e
MIRENKTAAGAGADRMSTGMTQSFGVVIGRMALVKPGQELYYISCANDKAVKVAREALRMVKSKVPCATKIIFEKTA